MPRFVTNRRLAFILALCVSLVCAFASSPSFAGGSDPSGRIIDDPYSPEFPNAVGDPDMPDAGGSGKFAKRVQVERGSMGTGWRSAGDSRFNHSVMVMIGKNVAPGVVGGVTAGSTGAFAASDIDSATGNAVTGGGVAYLYFRSPDRNFVAQCLRGIPDSAQRRIHFFQPVLDRIEARETPGSQRGDIRARRNTSLIARLCDHINRLAGEAIGHRCNVDHRLQRGIELQPRRIEEAFGRLIT